MSNTSDYNLANQVGSSFRAELNTVLGDVQSLNSGSSDPSTTVAVSYTHLTLPTNREV